MVNSKYQKRAREYQIFNQLSDSAKELFFDLLMNYADCDPFITFAMFGFEPILECKSPIEQMFLVAYWVATTVTGRNYILDGQCEIEANGHTYVGDFVLNNEHINAPTLKLIVECDGHDFHEKTKEQVERRNQRDMDLKMAGYEVLHFSGSEIYKEPFKCALNVIRFIDKKEGMKNERC